MNLQDIETVDDLLAAVDEYLTTPRFPPLNGADLNLITSKTIKIIIGQISLRAKTVIAVTDDFTINWQTQLVPGTNLPYAVKHGNGNVAFQAFAAEGNTETSYNPSVIISKAAGKITSIQFTGVFPGTLIII